MDTTAERCRRKSEFYHRRFDVPSMASSELIALLQQKSEEEGESDGLLQPAESSLQNIVLVDVRSRPERLTSVIPGSVSMHEFENELVPDLSPDATVVCYCTIGYRSGFEARRLRDRYHLDGRIYHLDGIISYTHASSSVALTAISDGEENKEEAGGTRRRLVDPLTNEETNRVHIFGPTWDCADDSYVPIHYSPPILVMRSAEVACISVLRVSQHTVHSARRWCLWCLCRQQRD